MEIHKNALVAAYCSEAVEASGEGPRYEFTASGLLSLLVDATAVSATPELVEQTLDVLPVLIDILAKATSAKPNCNAKDAKAELLSRCFITVFFDREKKSGLTDDYVATQYLSMAIARDMDKLRAKFGDPANPQLLCFVLFRCAKLFVKVGLIDEANFACGEALQIIASRPDMQHLDLAIILLQIRICGYKEEPSWEKLNEELRRPESDNSISALLVIGFIRESRNLNNPMLDLEMAEESLTRALKRYEELEETNNDAAKQATILLTLAVIYNFREPFSCGQTACENLSKQAIAGFKRVECRCGPHFMSTDYYDELFGATDCPRHQLLADALLYQGIAQSVLGLMISKEAQKSFEEGLGLVDLSHCTDDKNRLSRFLEYLNMLNPVCSHAAELSKLAEKPRETEASHQPDDIVEFSTSIGQVESSREASSKVLESEICKGYTTGRLLDLLLEAANYNSIYPYVVVVVRKAFPEVSDILASSRTSSDVSSSRHSESIIEIATRCLITIICDASRTRGKDENIAMCIEQVVKDMEKRHTVLATTNESKIQCFLIFRCAKILLRLEHKDLALRACDSAVQIVCEHFSYLKDQAVAILLLKYTILHADSKELVSKIIDELKSTKDHSTYDLLIMGFIRKCRHLNDQVLELKMKEALKREEDSNNDATKLATIRLTLAQYYSDKDSASSHKTSLELLTQAIAGFRQVDSNRCRFYMWTGYGDELFGGTDCPCHQLLGDAYYYQAVVLNERREIKKALESVEEGVKLIASYCNDLARHFFFHALWVFLQFYFNPGNPVYGLYGPRNTYSELSASSSTYEFCKSFEKFAGDSDLLDHIWKVVFMFKEEGKEDRSKEKDGTDLFFKETIAELQRQLQKNEQSGDYLSIVGAYSTMCMIFRSLGDENASKKHFLLAVETLKLVDISEATMPSWMDRDIYIQELMLLSQFAMEEYIMELDHAHDLSLKVFFLAEKKLEDLARITDEQVFRYFETTKHACMALAKCELLRVRSGFQLVNINMPEARAALPKNVTAEDMLACSRSLMWAERGKGRILLLSNVADSKLPIVRDPRLSKIGKSRLDVQVDSTDPDSKLVDVESYFLKNEDFALRILDIENSRVTPNFQSKKLSVYVEYTFIDQSKLLINVLSEGDRGPVRIFQIPLLRFLDPETRKEAENELELIKSSSNSEGNQTLSPSLEVPLAMNKYEVNRAPFNSWIPGMVAGIHRRAAEAQVLRAGKKDWRQKEEEIRKLLQKLYKILIEPIKRDLDTICRTNPAGESYTLVFVPHEDLGVVPFAALHDEDGSPYLIEQYAISVSPAIWISRQLEILYKGKVESSNQAEAKPLLVGRKSGYPYPWPILRDAHKEVAAVAQALDPAACLKFIDDNTDPEMRDMDARMKERVMEVLPKASWIHLSVHGEISTKYPQGSLLLGDNENQWLTAAEIINTGESSRLGARCAIASACQTGLGSVAGGGIMGFARAFILAGVPSCVLSMWQVNEAFSTSFMGNLYTRLREGNEIADAIQITIKGMMKEEGPSEKKKKRPRTPSEAARAKIGFTQEVEKSPSAEPKWSLLDWAVYSCFGLPGVKLPDSSLTRIPGTSTEATTPMSKSAAIAAPTSIEDRLALFSIDVNDDVMEECKLKGYPVVEETEGLAIFSSSGQSEADIEDFAALGTFVEAEEDSDDALLALKGSGSRVIPEAGEWRHSFVNLEDEQGSQTYLKILKTDQKAHASLAFRHGCDRSVSGSTGLWLRLYDAAFGVLGSIDEDSKRGHFVTRLEVCASPTGNCSSLVQHVGPGPLANSRNLTQKLQETSGRNNAAFSSMGASSVGDQSGAIDGSSSTQDKIQYFGWGPADIDASKKSVTWVWELSHWADGENFSVYLSPEWVKSSNPVPKLPYAHLDYWPALLENDENIILEAQWTVSNENLKSIEKVEWDITVNVCTASIERPRSLEIGNISRAGYKFETWDAVKEKQFYTSKITHDIVVRENVPEKS